MVAKVKITGISSKLNCRKISDFICLLCGKFPPWSYRMHTTWKRFRPLFVGMNTLVPPKCNLCTILPESVSHVWFVCSKENKKQTVFFHTMINANLKFWLKFLFHFKAWRRGLSYIGTSSIHVNLLSFTSHQLVFIHTLQCRGSIPGLRETGLSIILHAVLYVIVCDACACVQSCMPGRAHARIHACPIQTAVVKLHRRLE